MAETDQHHRPAEGRSLIMDCTQEDVYEIARLQSSDPLPTTNGFVCVEMHQPFTVKHADRTEYGEDGDYLVVHAQKMERHVLDGNLFKFLFETRQ